MAIVTGGNGGIGLGMARGLAEAGAAIAVVGRNEAKSIAAVAELERGGAKAIAVAADVTDKAAVAAMVARVESEFGRIDILVNNAGINIRKPPHELDTRRMEQRDRDQPHQRLPVLAGGLSGDEAAGGGKIINIGSMMSIFGASFAPAYAASKGGIVQLTRACACAWAADNIQVNAVLPGWIDTDLTERARAADRRPARPRAGAHARGALGRDRRFRRHRRVSRLARLRFRHRHGDPRRRRLFDHGLTPTVALGQSATKKAPGMPGL